jgi:hypothetical protein
MSKEILEKSKKVDIFIAPEKLRKYNILDPEKAEEIFEIGYKSANEILSDTEVRNSVLAKIK